jgi:hypothetical protein
MLHAPRHLVGSSQQKRESAGVPGGRSELRIVHSREAADLRQVAAHERQMVAASTPRRARIRRAASPSPIRHPSA